jgi:hypothetical protein
VLTTHVAWRETTDAVADSYGQWCIAPTSERAPRFAAYISALDQEQTATGMHAELISELKRWLPDSDRGDEPGGGWLMAAAVSA